MNIILMGYYGFKNVGDDLCIQELIKYFSGKEVITKIFVFCEDNSYETMNSKVVFCNTRKLSTIQKASILFQSDYLIWSGSTYNLKENSGKLLMAQKFAKMTGKRFSYIGVGLESFKSEELETKAKFLKNADVLYLRDKNSYELAVSKLKSVKSYLGGYLAFLNVDGYDKFIRSDCSSQLKNISFTGNFWWGEGRAEFYSQQLLPLIEKFNSVIHLLPAQLCVERNDNKFHKLLKNYLPDENCKLHSWNQPQDFVEILSQMDFHFGNRLHSIILADLLGIPNVGIDEYISKNSKIKNYIDKTEMLPLQRMLNFMEPIHICAIEQIFHEYQRPSKFILNESKTAKESVDLVLQERSQTSVAISPVPVELRS
ncbi:polysaccharide pyruvyl transferase family protein [Scytonema sp. UIC 10036]|uniref:polysaccharide pyruvyl transferase family protein n=1 Tax=Scytonema sp. UIC 10036 TaxID=2304196 RepID=UPI0012DA92A3|nr:polysaccharide pyruvyl transferase family protein [Scytonema sp. UIC 10036]MUG91290.1 polysaccharide pyruvyl transferase family protein [Scytonema sp. UIC 10036]